MLGWEYPPRVAGGLGVACAGLVRGLRESGEDDVHAGLAQAANQPRAGDAQTAGDAGRVFPPQHEDPHRGG